MRYLIAAVSLLVSSRLAMAAGPAPGRSKVDVAIDRGLAFLSKDALAWKAKHKCVSCHHASLVVWSMREAKRNGHAVEEPLLAELTKWISQAGDGKTGVPRPAKKPKALNTKAVQFALALGSDSAPDAASQQGMKLFVKTMQGDQLDNGSWVAWPETRPPFFGDSDESMTALATLAALPAAAAGDAAAKSVRDRGVNWLAQTKTDDDPQSVAIRLVIWSRLGRPSQECDSLVRRIKERQRADGGWSQTKEMGSDAWATGQALYALAHAGMTPWEPTIARAQTFLVKTQRDDGSWPMSSRPVKPGGAGSTSLIPITGGGTAWGIIGLARSR